MVSAEVKGHHTVWIKKPGWSRSVPIRYAVSGESLLAFADDGLAGLASGDRATATVHEIAGGPAVASFGVTVHEVPSDQVDREALMDLVAHVPLGATLAAVNARLDELARRRRLIALVP
jgi:hypothetical protein